MADELLDVVNDEDVVIDQEMRSLIHEKGLQHRGVHVFLFNKEGKMLIQKRSADRSASPSLLDCTVSEHVKAGESYLDAAIRGLQEEMGLDGIDVRPLVTFRMNYGPNDNEISTLYEGMIETEDVQFDTVEIEEVGFYTTREIQQQMIDDSRKFCGWFIEIFNWYIGQQSRLTVLKTE